MSTPGTAFPFQGPTDAATEYRMLQFYWRMMMLGVQTSILVEIVAVYPGGVGRAGTVDVLPLVDQIDGAGNTVPHQTIYGRPYFRLQGGLSAIICDPSVGDIGKCVFCSRDISSVIASAQAGNVQPSPPASRRLFNYADGLYVGGYLNATPEQYLQFLAAAAGINIQSLGVMTSGNLGVGNGATGTIVDANGVTVDFVNGIAVNIYGGS